jgi:hypothetical protein
MTKSAGTALIMALFAVGLIAAPASGGSLDAKRGSVSLDAKHSSIVVLKKDTPPKQVESLARDFAETARGRVTAIYPALKAFAIDISPDRAELALQQFRKEKPKNASRIQGIGANGIATLDQASCSQPRAMPHGTEIPVGVLRVGGPLYDGPSDEIKLRNKTVWVIDSGVDVSSGEINIDGMRATNCVGGMCMSGSGTDTGDVLGHGTMVAGIIAAGPAIALDPKQNLNLPPGFYGVAPGAMVVPVKVFDHDGQVLLTDGPLAGLDHVYGNAKAGDVVNISWGAPWVADLTQNGITTFDLVNRTVRGMADNGLRVAVAAGNAAGAQRPRWVQFVMPAGAGSYFASNASAGVVLTVSAVQSVRDAGSTWTDTLWVDSDYGNNPPDYAEPGVDITSLWKRDAQGRAQIATCSGTSFAAPHLSGILLRGMPGIGGRALHDPDDLGHRGNDDPVGIAP